MVKQLVKAYVETIANSQILVENYLEYLADFTQFRPIPGNVRVRLEDQDWTLNAYAAQTDEGYLIAVNAGTIPHLVQPITEALKLDCIPEVSNREKLARWLISTALDFLIFHELGHIALAHLDYLEKMRWNDLDAENTKQSDFDTHVAIELMADEFAAAAVANRYLDPRFEAGSGISEFSNSDVYDNALLFAIGVLCLVMTPHKKLATFAATTHPHPEFRLGVVMALLWQGRPTPDRKLSRRTMSDLSKVPRSWVYHPMRSLACIVAMTQDESWTLLLTTTKKNVPAKYSRNEADAP